MVFKHGTRMVLGLVVLVTACGTESSPPGETGAERTPVTDGAFRMSIDDDLGNLDPHMSTAALTHFADSFMYDSLIAVDENGEIIPYLAESWEVDLESVTYTLVDGITCADGSPLTASDVAANFNFIGDPENESPRLGVWIQPGTTATADDEAGTVTVTAAEPDPFLLVGSGQVHIVCRAGLEDRSLLEEGSAGTGMFTLTEAKPGDRYTMERRDEHAWAPGGAAATDPGTPASVTLRVVAAEPTAANLFLAGELEAVRLDGADAERVEQTGVDSYPDLSLAGLLFFNQAEGRPGADPAVRVALAQAADFDAVREVTTGGRGEPADGFVTGARVCTADTVSGSTPEHDPQAAEAALDAAGWQTGSNGVRSRDGEPLALTLLHFTDSVEVTSGAELLAQQWEEVGADVTLKPVTDTQANEVLFGSGGWDAGLVPIQVGFPSQFVPFLSGTVPPDGINFAHIANEEYEAAVTEASNLPLEEGCPFWEDAERALVAAADAIPFAYSVIPTFVDGVELQMLGGAVSPPTIRLYE